MGWQRWWTQFKAMTVKNFTYRRRHWVQTIFEIIVPLLIILILACIRPAVSKNNHAYSLHEDDAGVLLDARPAETFQAVQQDPSLVYSYPSKGSALYFLMNNTVTWNFRFGIVAPDDLKIGSVTLFEDFKAYINQTFEAAIPGLTSRIIRFNTNDDIDSYCTGDSYITDKARPLSGAVVFLKTGDEWQYRIRMNVSDTDATYKAVPDTWNSEDIAVQIKYDDTTYDLYFRHGFLGLQSFIDDYILLRRMQTITPGLNEEVVLSHNTTVWPFPTPAYKDDPLLDGLAAMISMFFVYAYMWPVARVVGQLVGEKETRTKELFQTMGLYPSVLTCAWLVNYVVIYVISSVLMAFATMSVYQYSNTLLIGLLFFAFSLAMFSFAYLLQCLFNKTGVATFVGCVGLFILYFGVLAIQGVDTPLSTLYIMSLDFVSAFALGLFELTKFESGQSGISWDNWDAGVTKFSLMKATLMLFVDFFLYMGIALYLERVLPQTYGVREKWYFPFSPSYWKGVVDREEKKPADQVSVLAGDANQQGPAVEPRDAVSASKVAIKMQNLCKVWNKGTPMQVKAVNNLTMDVAEGEIFVLLGHNGAGKSTSVSIVTGMYQPSAGDCTVYGQSIIDNMPAIRKNLGVCHQQNIIYDELTVAEHLYLYGAIKSMSEQQMAAQVPEIIQQVGLAEKTDSWAGTLSGGQKRRLCLAMALIGDSKVIFLDEPTSGMDPYSRRMTWDLLKKKKEGRVIILTTHFMDEADQLGDRIAIMAKGELRCVGSSLFLKKKYGVGYTFTVSKEKDFQEVEVTNLIHGFIPNAERVSNIAGELSFRLPFEGCSKFPDMFDKIDQSKAKLGVQAYSISVTTLEEVFLRVARDEEDPHQVLETQLSKHNIHLSRQLSKLKQQQQQAGNKPDSTTAVVEIKSEKKAGEVELSPAGNDKQRENQINEIVGELKRMGSEQLIPTAADDLAVKTVKPSPFDHVKACFLKRWHTARRDKSTWTWTVLYPLLIIIAFMALTKMGMPDMATYKEFKPALYSTDIPQFIPVNTNPTVDAIFDKTNGVYPESTLQFDQYTAANAEQFVNELYMTVSRSDGRPHDHKTSKHSAFFLNPADPNPLNSATIFFNTTGYHALPMSFNILSNYRMNAFLKPHQQQCKIVMGSQPLPLTAAESAMNSTLIVFALLAGFAFVPACYSFFIVKERETGAKHQQSLSGVGIFAYWFANLLWDIVNFIPVIVLTMIFLALFDVAQLVDGTAFSCTILAMFLFAVSGVSFAYLCTFLFKEPDSAQNVILMIFIVAGAIFNIAAIVLGSIDSTKDIGDVLRWIFRIFPPFCLGEITSALVVRRVAAFWSGKQKDAWDFDLVGKSFIFMAVESVVYFLLVLLIERALMTPEVVKRMSAMQQNVEEVKYDEDADVLAEEKRVAAGGADKEMIKIDRLRKVYPTRMGAQPKVALKGLSLGIPEGECFGLLGINGAGKTTAISCLTGVQVATSGDAWMKGFNIMTQQPEIRSLLGYCPQFDALFDKMTATEHLYFYGRLKGIPEDVLPGYVGKMIHKMGLDAHADKPSDTYSGGNKRKLSVGIALMGNPSIIFLDEPSTGMDPNARRFMWGVIASTMAGRSVVLTTHNMEECEALCSRIGILVSGRLRCLGNSTHLKTTHGAGYQLDVNLPLGNVPQLKEFLNGAFPGVKLIEHHQGNLKYRIPPGSSLGGIFRTIETQVKALQISEYAVSETTLEQIFLHFAKQQDEDQQDVAGLDGDDDGPKPLTVPAPGSQLSISVRPSSGSKV